MSWWHTNRPKPVIAGATEFAVGDTVTYRDHLGRKAIGVIEHLHECVFGDPLAQIDQLEPKFKTEHPTQVILAFRRLMKCQKVPSVCGITTIH